MHERRHGRPPGAPQVLAVAPVAAPPKAIVRRLAVQARAVELIVAGTTDSAAAEVVPMRHATVTRRRRPYNLHFAAEVKLIECGARR